MSIPVEAVVELVEDLFVAGVHALDPEERKKTVREAVQREASKWAALDPGLESTRLDEIAKRHHVEWTARRGRHQRDSRGAGAVIPSVEYVPARYWRFGRYVYDRSTVLACGPVQLRWRRA